MHRGLLAGTSLGKGMVPHFRRAGLSPVRPGDLLRQRRRGQSAVEAALTAAVAIMTILVTLQLSLVAAQQFSATYVAQSTARWLAVRMDTIDADVTTQANVYATSLPGLSGGGMTSVTTNPSCPSLVAGKCTSRDTGVAVTVTVTTSLAPIMFLPTSFGVSPFVFNLPTSMPAISYTVLLE